MSTETTRPPATGEWRLAGVLFLVLLVFHGWAASVGWRQGNLPGNEFRQAQTALSTLFIQRDRDFSLAYPTPVLGQPWSVPMEFPLYQWTVVKVCDWTGLPLIPAGRAVSLACFYLALAALYPLLGRLGLAAPRRLVVMGLLLSCPLYIFYARSFLIETMALMFSAWFVVAFGRMITAPTWGRLLLAAALGVPAGLIKVTTFMVFLLVAAGWTLAEMRRQFAPAGWAGAARRGFWALGAIVLPLLVTGWWTRFADAVKQRNPVAEFLNSGGLLNFNFGNADNRFSGATLGAHWHNLSHNVAGPLLLVAGGVLLATGGWRWWRQIALCLGCYLASLALFPTLYAWHDYYAIANGGLLLAALGLAVAAGLNLRPRWLPWVVLLGLHASQIWLYRQAYFVMQHGAVAGGDAVPQAIRRMTTPDEVIVATGYDWNSSLPFFAERRALMIRNGMERDASYLEKAFAAQKGLRVTVLVVGRTDPVNPMLLATATRYFDLDPRPLFVWRDAAVYGRRDLRARMIAAIQPLLRDVEIHLGDMAGLPAWPPVDREVGIEDLLERDLTIFSFCTPKPWKFYTQHGSYLTNEADRPALFVHPTTRLWFKAPAGRRVMRVECAVQAKAYDGPVHDRTDGVEFIVERERPDGTRERLGALLLDPAHVPADAGWHVLEVTGELAADDSLVLSTGPGPAGSFARDWAVIGAVKIN